MGICIECVHLNTAEQAYKCSAEKHKELNNITGDIYLGSCYDYNVLGKCKEYKLKESK